MWNDHDGYGMHDAMGGSGWLTTLAVLLVLLLLAVAVGVVLWVVVRRRPVHGLGPSRLLAERYARGEIDDEEYAHRLEVLGSP